MAGRGSTRPGSTSSSVTRASSTHGDRSSALPTPRRSSGAAKGTTRISSSALSPPSKLGMLKERVEQISRDMVENTFISGLLTLLTVFVLVGDDVRLMTTDRPADIIFSVLGFICIALFSLEVIISCLGKEDYFLGFFFFLDAISTATLVFDVPWVSDSLYQANSDGVKGNQQGGLATAAKATRLVRVLRLVRIVKLYKAMHERRERRDRIVMEHRTSIGAMNSAPPGSGIDLGLDEEEDLDQPERETRVGKRLSELTTRRVVVLVLTMLLLLPFLAVDESRQIGDSATYGADEVWWHFSDLISKACPAPGSAGPSAICEASRSAYEQAMLRYLYFHNWFTARTGCPHGRMDSCPSDFYNHVFMVGITGRDLSNVQNISEMARLRAQTVEAWQQRVKRENALYNYGAMPDDAAEILGSPWEVTCDIGASKLQGFSLLVPGVRSVDYHVTCPDDLRPVERLRYHPQRTTEAAFSEYHIAFWFDRRPFIAQESLFGLLLTGVVCLLLLGASVVFHNDVSQLVLSPVEALISRAETIRDQPMKAIEMAEIETRKEDVKKNYSELAGKQGKFKTCLSYVTCSQTENEPFETILLERTIIKLGTLLVLGFGEAGANIVTQNMSVSETAGVNVMISGLRVECIIGYMRIQDFSIFTEVLQSRVMTFVNQVSEIVHGLVREFSGAPNKNNGDTFMVIWRTTDMDQNQASKLADLSVTAFVRIMAAVKQSPMLDSYRGHPGLQWRMSSEYRVSLTSGLHSGWAIEGAVGSEFKVDASYLSPNVSVALNVQDATQIYGVRILATEAVVNLCSEAMKRKFRLVDHVFISGSTTPLQLYSMDLYTNALSVDEPMQSGIRVMSSKLRFKARQWLDSERSRKLRMDSVEFFDGDPCISGMREKYSEQFLHLFSMGYQNYSEGEWTVAKRFLGKTHTMLGFPDGPSCALMDFMASRSFEAPEAWDGVRDLDDVSKDQRVAAPVELETQHLGGSNQDLLRGAVPSSGSSSMFAFKSDGGDPTSEEAGETAGYSKQLKKSRVVRAKYARSKNSSSRVSTRQRFFVEDHASQDDVTLVGADTGGTGSGTAAAATAVPLPEVGTFVPSHSPLASPASTRKRSVTFEVTHSSSEMQDDFQLSAEFQKTSSSPQKAKKKPSKAKQASRRG